MVTDTDKMVAIPDILRWFGFYELKESKGCYHRKMSTTIGMLLALADSPPCTNGEWGLIVAYFEKETPASAMDDGVTALFEHVGSLGSCLTQSVRFADIAIKAAKVAVKNKADPTTPGLPDFGDLLKGLKL